jgi:hypothetical protein
MRSSRTASAAKEKYVGRAFQDSQLLATLLPSRFCAFALVVVALLPTHRAICNLLLIHHHLSFFKDTILLLFLFDKYRNIRWMMNTSVAAAAAAAGIDVAVEAAAADCCCEWMRTIPIQTTEINVVSDII